MEGELLKALWVGEVPSDPHLLDWLQQAAVEEGVMLPQDDLQIVMSILVAEGYEGLVLEEIGEIAAAHEIDIVAGDAALGFDESGCANVYSGMEDVQHPYVFRLELGSYGGRFIFVRDPAEDEPVLETSAERYDPEDPIDGVY